MEEKLTTNKISKKYTVYENDLKFHNVINPKKTNWHTEDVKQKYLSNITNTLDYRISEAKKNKYEYLDLSYLNLTILPNFTNHVDYQKLKNIKFLFVNNNKIENIDNSLLQFKLLQVLDISCNKIKKIESIPNSLIELVCHNNELEFVSESNNLLTFDCSFNKMKSLSNYSLVQNLMCENNNITELNSFINAKHITIKNNPLIKLHDQPTVEFLNIENTSLSNSLPNMPKLKWLICHDTNIRNIELLRNIEHIEMTNCSISEIPYLEYLQDILCDLTNKLKINEKMKLKTYLIERNHVYYVFSTKNSLTTK